MSGLRTIKLLNIGLRLDFLSDTKRSWLEYRSAEKQLGSHSLCLFSLIFSHYIFPVKILQPDTIRQYAHVCFNRWLIPKMRIVSIDPIGLLLARLILVHGRLQQQKHVCLNWYLLSGPEEIPDSNNCMHRRSLNAHASSDWSFGHIINSAHLAHFHPTANGNLNTELNAWNRQRSAH